MFKKSKESIKCKYCGSIHTVCNGNKYGKQRYKCKECNKSFSKEDDRIKHNIKQKELVLLLYSHNMSMRSIQRVLENFYNIKISFKLIVHWIESMSKKLEIDIKKNKEKPKTIEVLEMDELYSKYYDLKKNEWKELKYGLLLTETGIKLLRLK